MPLIAALAMVACGGSPRDPDTAKVDLHLRIERLDSALFHAPLDSTPALTARLGSAFGSFYPVYIEEILKGAPVGDPRLPLVLSRFVQDPDWNAAQQAVDSVLGDLEPQRIQFEDGFKRLKALFPDSLVPRVVAYNSGYNYGVFPTDSVLGIGLEWFIGADQPVIGYLDPTSFPQYVKARMRPDMLVPGAMKGWLLVHYTKDVRGEDLLNNLVEIGKVLYLLETLLPGEDAANRFAFTPAQLKWCEEHEFSIWQQIVSEELLYSKKSDSIDRLMNDGPFSTGFPHESPGHLGEWIGYRMVKSYMDDHPAITVPQLLATKDARLILKSYKPR